MTDAALFWFVGDEEITFIGGDLPQDNGLSTAVLLSLFVDRRASNDQLPDDVTDPRGYWNDTDQDQHGSHLWLIDREKITNTTIERAKKYTEEALRWMITDGIASKVNVTVERSGIYALAIKIRILQGKNRQYKYLWDDHKNTSLQAGVTRLDIEFE